MDGAWLVGGLLPAVGTALAVVYVGAKRGIQVQEQLGELGKGGRRRKKRRRREAWVSKRGRGFGGEEGLAWAFWRRMVRIRL